MRPRATDPSLSPRQLKAIDMLIQFGDVAAAATEADINKATLYRWLKEPVFAQAVHAAEARAIDELSRLLVRLGRTATSTLAKAMTDPGNTHGNSGPGRRTSPSPASSSCASWPHWRRG